MSKTQFTATVQESGDDLIIEFPHELMEQMGWSAGTTLQWEDRGDGTYALSAVKE